MRYLKLFEEHTTDNVKDEVVKEFERIILINHKVSGDLNKALSDAYDKGFEIGQLSKQLGSKFHDHPTVKGFNPDDKIGEPTIKVLKPQRIANNRDFTYNATDIADHSRVLVSDITVAEAIESMEDPSEDYMYFSRRNAEKKEYEDSIKKAYDAEDKENIVKEYHTLEVKIFLQKCYQVGFSEGEKVAKEVPSLIRNMFDNMTELADYKKGIKTIIRTDKEAEMAADYVERLKERFPEWKDYAHLYPNIQA